MIKDKSGNLIKANAWDNDLKQPGLIKGDKGGICGENRYMGVVNILEFYITKGCDLYIEPIDSIYAAVRMNWTMEGFYSNGGTTQFVDRLAGVLGIHAANIKIVSVYMGSVVVQFMIMDDPKFPLNQSTGGNLTAVQQTLFDKLAKKNINLGAPILGADIKGLPVTLVSNPQDNTNTVIDNLPTTLPGEKKPVVKPIVIVNENPSIIEVTQSSSDTNSLDPGIVAAVTVVIVLVILSSGIGYVWYKKYQARQQEMAKEAVPNNSVSVSVTNKTGPSQVGINPNSGMDNTETFEVQYHPKTEIGNIFGYGDPIKKGNDADMVIEEDDEDYDSPERGNGNHLNLPTDSEQVHVTNTPDHQLQDNTPLHDVEKVSMSFGKDLGNQDLKINGKLPFGNNSGRVPGHKSSKSKGVAPPSFGVSYDEEAHQ